MAGFLSPTGTDPATLKAQGDQQRTLQNAGKAYSNYRQFSRDNYANQLSNQSSLYQGMMNRLASAYGGQGSPNIAQMSNSPMSLRQTTVGSVYGSNAAGWGQGNAQTPAHPEGQDNYGIIGQMGAINPNDEAFMAGNSKGRPQASIDSNGNQIQQSPSGGASGYAGYDVNNINTNSASNMPQQVGQTGAGGGFSFAPRRS